MALEPPVTQPRATQPRATQPPATGPRTRADWRPTHRQAVFGLVTIAVLLRFALAPYGGHFFDIPTMKFWGFHLVTDPLSEFYNLKQQFLPEMDHLPGDLWLLIILTRFFEAVTGGFNLDSPLYLFLLKLVPTLADAGVGVMLYALGSRLYSRNLGVIAAIAFLFNPASLFLTSIWGQWDSVSMCFALISLWCLITGRLMWVLPALCYATLIKPQFGAFIPLFALAYWFTYLRPAVTKRQAGEEADVAALVMPVVIGAVLSFLLAAALLLPFSVGLFGIGHWSIIERVEVAVNLNKFTTLFAFNIWAIVTPPTQYFLPDDVPWILGVNYQVWGTAFMLIGYAAVLVLYARRPTSHQLVWATLATMMVLYMLPTRIHERYMFPVVVLMILPALGDELYRRLFYIVSFTYFINLWFVYTAQDPPPIFRTLIHESAFFYVFSLANVAVLATLFYRRPLAPGERRRRRPRPDAAAADPPEPSAPTIEAVNASDAVPALPADPA